MGGSAITGYVASPLAKEELQCVVHVRGTIARYGRAMHAALLAGGRSLRMGRPKAHLDVLGTPLWRFVADRLGGMGFDVVVATGSDAWDTAPYKAVSDGGRGPLDGIAAASDGSDLFVWTVDVPDVDDVTSLAGGPPGTVCCLKDADGRAQPLLARWPAEVVAAIPAYLDAGGRSVLGFLDGHRLEAVGPPRDRTHLTTPQDVERWLGSV